MERKTENAAVVVVETLEGLGAVDALQVLQFALDIADQVVRRHGLHNRSTSASLELARTALAAAASAASDRQLALRAPAICGRCGGRHTTDDCLSSASYMGPTVEPIGCYPAITDDVVGGGL